MHFENTLFLPSNGNDLSIKKRALVKIDMGFTEQYTLEKPNQQQQQQY